MYKMTAKAPSRRAFLQQIAGTGLAAAAGVALLPGMSLAQMQGQTPADATKGAQGDLAILNYALTLERLEAMFYNLNGDKAYLGTGTLKAIIAEIRDHENDHVRLLEGALGANAQPAPQFQGLDAATLPQFLMMAQTFEDVGVSAYLGQVPNIQDKGILATAGAIMAVEARHAGGIRAYRKTAPSAGNPPEGGDATVTLVPDRAALEKPRTRAEVLALVAPFIIGAAPATQGHDLAITAIQVPATVSARADAEVIVLLHNRGTANENYHIYLRYMPGGVIINDYVDSIPAGQMKSVGFIWPKGAIGSAGARTLVAQVDTASGSVTAMQNVTVTT